MDLIVREINKEYAKFLIFSISAESPLFLLQEIREQLNPNKGDVIVFDQLLQTGDTENRFLSITFGDMGFNLSTVKHLENAVVDAETRSIIADYLRNNTLLLKYSILLSKQKEIILQGGVI